MLKLIVSGLLILFLGVGIGVYYQQDAGGVGPQSVWYALDRVGEWVELNLLTFNEAGRLELRLKFMQERLDELLDLARNNELSKEYAQKIDQEYTKLAQDVKQGLKKKAENEIDTQTKNLLQKVELTIAKQQQSLEEVLSKAPDIGGDSMKEAFSVMRDIYQQAIDLVGVGK
ncbi:hypothetical protein HY250_02360 [Candidatus Azambacteria bacterium]|nr:hypothetical protein [Candidatus Azambacteria bacterium]